MAPQFRTINLLLADPDIEISRIVRSSLLNMGLVNVSIVRDGSEALSRLYGSPSIDLLITDWQMKKLDGIELINRVRKESNSPNPLLPIIMLTARGTPVDVGMARDAGINEYLLKPFTAKTIFHRINQVVEHPRPFIITPGFTGPDRRRRGSPPEGVAERRSPRTQPVTITKDMLSIRRHDNRPRIIAPDFSLRRKLGISSPLSEIVNETALAMAQQVIDDAQNESIGWIRENILQLEQANADLAIGTSPQDAVERLKEATLAVKSRAGTFGFGRVSDIAWLLYRFFRETFTLSNPSHRIVITKHIQTIKVLIATGVKGDGGEIGSALLKELGELIKKYS